MKKIGVLLGVLFLSACATATYPTNVPITQAVTVFGNIGPLASQEGYQVQSNGDRLHIAFDTATEIQYVADPEFTGGPNILIGVMVQDGKVPEHEVGARMQAASQKAYEWLKKSNSGCSSGSGFRSRGECEYSGFSVASCCGAGQLSEVTRLPRCTCNRFLSGRWSHLSV